MIMRICLLAASIGLFTGSSSQADEPSAPKKQTFWVIPHTHWEGAVFKTREEYLEMGLPNIVKAMRLLKEQPSFHFTLDQVAYVRPFLERYPEEEANFRRFLAEGRLQLAGALDVMPDVNMPGGETFVRQMQYGKGYYREKLGVDVTTGWLLDTFGHHAQMPQLLAQGGYKSFWFFRGVPRQDYPSEFFWEGIDGTKIAAYWLPYGYGLAYGAPNETAGFARFMQDQFKSLDQNAHGPDRIGPAGVDVCEPEEHLAARVEEFNRDPKAPFAIRLAVPSEVEAAISRRTDRPVFKGELNPIFQGIYSSRIELKSWMRITERQLLTAEKLSSIAGLLGSPADLAAIMSSWEPVLFNETHDLASGVMTDHVYEDTVGSYSYSERRAGAIIASKWDVLASKIDTRGEGAPVLVFNPLGWKRSDAASVDLGFGEGGVSGIKITDHEGQPVPTQVVESTRYWDGGLKTARVAFIARDVPALGYRTFHATPFKGSAAGDDQSLANPTPKPAAGETILENELYRVSIDPSTGAIASLVYKPASWQVLSGPGNVVSREEDHGDFWEPYKGLDGGSRIAMTNQQKVPARGKAVYSDEGKSGPGNVVSGRVFSEFRVERPFGSGKFATAISVFQGLRRIEVTTRLVNQEKFVRYQAHFPTTIKEGKATHEIPFGSSDRPSGIEFPAQNWADYGDGRRGLALLNVGLPGNLVSDGTMLVSLLRAHTLGAYGFGGGYEPGMSSETGFQLGRERTMRYALVPHEGDWSAARVFRDGWEFNHPLVCRTVLPHEGPLPKSWGLVEVSSPDVVVSSLKPTQLRDVEHLQSGASPVALRVYEASGRAAAGVTLKLSAKILAAHEANLMEDVGAEIKVDGDSVKFDLRPFEIKTIRLYLRSL
jgi:alpha-mannosidase